MSDVAALIRQSRARAGLSQAEVAARAGTSQPAFARYEAGTSLPTLPTLERLLAACGRRLEVRSVRADRPPTGTTSVRGQLGPQAQILRRKRRQVLEAARARGMRRVRVFGSLARGEGTRASDVDFLVELDQGRTLLDVAAFRREAERITGMSVDVVTADMLKDRIRDEVLAQAVPL